MIATGLFVGAIVVIGNGDGDGLNELFAGEGLGVDEP